MFKIKFSTLVLNLLAALALSQTTQAADFFVSPTGNDNNVGTSAATAWRTVAKINNRSFAAGDRVFFEGGQTFTGNLSFGADDAGNAAQPITVGSYGTGRATITAGSGRGVYVYNTAGFVIKDLIVNGGWNATSQSGNSSQGVFVYTDRTGAVKLNFIRINNVEASGFRAGGIVIGASPSDASKSGFEDVRITNSVARDNGDVGITTFGYFDYIGTTYAHRNVYVGNCKTFNNRGILNKGANTGSGIVLSDVDNGVVERSVSYNNGEYNNFGGGGPYGIWTWDSNNIRIQFNEAYNNRTGTADGGGFDIDGGVTNSVVQYNYSHDNQGPGYGLFQFSYARPFNNNTIRYNISQNDGLGFYFWDGYGDMGSVDIYHNTIFSRGTVVRTISDLNQVRFFNNIFFTAANALMFDIYSARGLTFQNNVYWASGGAFTIRWAGTTYNSLEAWAAATGQETRNGVRVGRSVDPKLTAPGNGPTFNDANQLNTLTAYKLQSGSPLINAGLDPAAVFGINPGATDFYGTNVPQNAAFDIGAHEFANGAPTSGTGTGLTAEYFDNLDFTNLKTVRTDAQIDFDWGIGTPSGTALTAPDTFSVRWTGQIEAPATGSYTFTTTSDDGVRLSINDQLVIDNWTNHAPTDNSATVNLTAGQRYSIKMEYYENGGGAVAKLFWAYPNQTKQIVPQSRLYAATNANLVVNSSFEADGAATQTPANWQTWSSAGHEVADYTETVGGAHSGSLHGTHWRSDTAYDVYTYQTFDNLENGVYKLRAFIKSSGGQLTAQMEAKRNLGGSADVAVPIAASGAWTPLELTIQVTNNRCTIGFYSQATAGQWIYFDSVEFSKQP